MTALILAVALAGQAPTADDLACERAVEESVCRWSHAAPPEPYRSLIAGLGASRWKDREAADAALQATGPDGRRWLWWARTSRDAEVRARANAIIRRMSPCDTCGGSGSSKNWEPWPCWTCEGSGSTWPRSPWD